MHPLKLGSLGRIFPRHDVTAIGRLTFGDKHLRQNFVATRATRNGPWGTPVNLGPTVNTAYWDHFQVLLGDGLLLFFYSTRPGGYGGADLYVMSRASLSDWWAPPVNLGPLVNSAGDEYFGYMLADGSTLFFNSDRSGGYGGHDIWQAPILAAPLCGDAEHPYPAVDLNKEWHAYLPSFLPTEQ